MHKPNECAFDTLVPSVIATWDKAVMTVAQGLANPDDAVERKGHRRIDLRSLPDISLYKSP